MKQAEEASFVDLIACERDCRTCSYAAALDCALRRYVRDRAYTVSRPSDLVASFTVQTGIDPTPILAPLGLH